MMFNVVHVMDLAWTALEISHDMMSCLIIHKYISTIYIYVYYKIKSAFAFLHVGPMYGCKMMEGLLSSQGVHVSEKQSWESLCIINPGYQHAHRMATAHQVNPVPYHAEYFGRAQTTQYTDQKTWLGLELHMCSAWLQWDDSRVCYTPCL